MIAVVAADAVIRRLYEFVIPRIVEHSAPATDARIHRNDTDGLLISRSIFPRRGDHLSALIGFRIDKPLLNPCLFEFGQDVCVARAMGRIVSHETDVRNRITCPKNASWLTCGP